jgi:hypothetical protein
LQKKMLRYPFFDLEPYAINTFFFFKNK